MRRRSGGPGTWTFTILRAVAAIAVASSALVAIAHRPAAAAPALPSGFVVRDMLSGQSGLLTDFAFAPDGSYFTSGKNGRVAWVSASGAPKTLAELPVVTDVDLGLMGIALAPDYATSKTLYTVRATPLNGQPTHRLSAWTVAGAGEPVSLVDERVVLELPATSGVHSMTTVLPAPDGTLWVSTGDSADFTRVDPRALRALDVNEGYGKLLHVLPNGHGVSSNPQHDPANPASWRSRVYARGFRSPFRFSLDPANGAPILADVGWNSFEEINVVRPGASYGWPCWEGASQTPGYKDLSACNGVGNSSPLWTYPRGPLGTSVTGGVVYTGSSYPDDYQGAYFFGDYGSQRLYTLRHGEGGVVERQPEPGGFGSGIGAPVRFGAAANGDIVYADIMTSTLKRLVYAAGNRSPTAAAVITNRGGGVVEFDGSDSSDLDGDPLTYRWDFGDGSTGTGARASHTYAQPGTAPVVATLTVRDTQGLTGVTTSTVVPANTSAQLDLRASSPETRFAVGDALALSAAATDAEDGPLPITWQTVVVHCSGGYCHDHPGRSSTGPSFAATFDDHGDDTRLEIVARATDTDGATTQKTYVAQPRLHRLTVASSAPAAITVNGSARFTALVTARARISLIAPTTSTDGVATFDRWADGAPREREIVMPDTDTRLEASYLTPIERRYAEDPQLNAAVGAPTSAEVGDASLRYRDHVGGRVYWTPRAGVHEVHGAIYGRYLAAGAHVRLGEPLTDETVLPDGQGRKNDFAGAPLAAASIYWTPQTGAHLVSGAIRELWVSMGAERSPHGYPTTEELPTPNARGRFNSFQNGGIYWTAPIGARSVYGAIYERWARQGWENGFLGFPLTNETSTSDGIGRFNHFEGGSIYWTPQTGARVVSGPIGGLWRSMGAEAGPHRYPITDEQSTPNRRGRYSSFQNGGIYWTAPIGARSVYGAIYARWARHGWEGGFLGFPVTNETGTPDGIGRFNHFQGGSIYWTPRTGAFEVHGAIRARWQALGWERSYLGYPTSDELTIPGGKRSNFERGYITWNARTGQVIDRRY